MRKISVFHYTEWTMKRKLFGYMLFLAILLLASLVTFLSLFGLFESTAKNTYESLDIQMEVFENDISTHFDHLAASGIQLSEHVTMFLEDYLNLHDISFFDLQDSERDLATIQEYFIATLQQKMLQTDCSGIFVMLDTTINSSLDTSDFSKTGVYLQINGYEPSRANMLLYRGIASIGKKYDIMPHRKWRLEFQTEQFPNYTETFNLSDIPLHKAYRLTDLFTLPGTSEQAVLLTIPIWGSDSTYYGICGFELSASYFLTHHAQPSKQDHLTCLLTMSNDDILDSSNGLSCGVSNGYYRIPKCALVTSNVRNGLLQFTGDTIPYIGITRTIQLTPNNEAFTLAVMIPKSDYDRVTSKNTLKNLVLWMLLLFFTVNCCLYFSRRFLTPILRGLEQLKRYKQETELTQVPEINDLFAFLAEQDKEHEKSLCSLMEERDNAKHEKDQLELEYQKALDKYQEALNKYQEAYDKYQTAQTEVSRLAYSRKQEVDPDDYKQFIAGIDTLTPTEKRIFEYYLSGKTVKEITEIASIKESTLRYHNQNIYSKLGVHSLKQLLRYAALMGQET